MESKFYEDKKMLVFKITDEIDDCSVQKIRRKADYEIERYMPRKVVFDFDSVTFMDSAGIQICQYAWRKTRSCKFNSKCKKNI